MSVRGSAWTRRAILATGALAALGALAADRRAGVTWRFTPGVRLRPAVDPTLTRQLALALTGYLQPTPDHPGHPSFPGAVALAAVDGVLAGPVAVGYTVRYAGTGTELPADQWQPTAPDTVYDLASLTKVFTTVLALRLVEAGALALDRPVRNYLPGFAGAGKEVVTSRMLLRHVSGLPADVDLVHRPGGSAEAALLGTPLVHRPGRVYLYSDCGMATLGLVIAAVGGAPLDRLLREQVTGVLGLADTGYRPLDSSGAVLPGGVPVGRIAATEAEPWVDRPMLRGAVHDEMAFALGGVSGHAGVFGSAPDLAVFAQALLDGGGYGDAQLLRPATLRTALRRGPVSPYGLGFELDQPAFMGRLAGPATFGHTGFTGTSLVVDLPRRALLVVLTNRVHPTRAWGAINPTRRRLADLLAAAVDGPATGLAAAGKVGHFRDSQQFGTGPLYAPCTGNYGRSRVTNGTING